MRRRYVHRRGRTARAGAEGLSLALVGEQDTILMRRILREMGYDHSRNLATFPVDRKYAIPLPCPRGWQPHPAHSWHSLAVACPSCGQYRRWRLGLAGLNAARLHRYSAALKKRLQLALKIDDVQRKNKKASAEDEWLKKAAADLEVDLSDDENADIAMENKKVRKQLAAQRKELDDLLNQPLLPAGFSTRHLAMDPSLATKIVSTAAATLEAAKARQQQKQGQNEKAKKKAKTTGVEREKKNTTVARTQIGAVRERMGNHFTVENAGLTALGTLALCRAGLAAVQVGVNSGPDHVRDNENLIAEQRSAKARPRRVSGAT